MYQSIFIYLFICLSVSHFHFVFDNLLFSSLYYDGYISLYFLCFDNLKLQKSCVWVVEFEYILSFVYLFLYMYVHLFEKMKSLWILCPVGR